MIVLFGIAGSGKVTQAEILAGELNCPILSTGELLRQNRDNPAVKAAVEKGVLVADTVLLPMIEKEFAKIGATKNEFILDGTPRNEAQARWLADKIKSDQLKLTAIIHILLSKETALARLKLRGRHDDTEQLISERFKFYEQSVVPAINYLADQGFKITEIDGDHSVEEVASQIRKTLAGS